MHDGYGICKRSVEGRRLLEFCEKKELCVANAWLEKKEQRKITYSMGGNEIEIDFVLVGKNNKVFRRRESYLGVAISVSGNRNRQKKVEKSS